MQQLLFECFLLTGCERFQKPRKAELVDSSPISREMDVAHFLYRNNVLEVHSSHKEIEIHLMI